MTDYAVSVEQLPMGTYVNAVADEVRTVYVSPQLEALLGWTLEDWAQDGFFASVLHPEDRDAVLAAVDRFHRTGERFSVEYRLTARGGRVVWVHDETVVVHDEHGRPAFLQGFVIDITEHRSHQAFVAGQRTVLELIARGEPLDRVLEEITRRVEGQLDGTTATVLPEAEEDDGADGWSSTLRSSAGERLGVMRVEPGLPRLPDARERRVLEAAAHAASIAIERDRDERSLREAEAKYRTLVEQLPVGSYINSFGTKLRPLYVSPELVNMLGYSLDDWNEDDFLSRIIHPDDRGRVLEQVVRTHELGERFAADYRLRAADGRWVWVHDETVPVVDDRGNRLFLQGFMLDITERKQLEAKLLHAQKLEAVGRLAGGVAHDFNNVLTAIIGYAQFLLARLADGDPRRADAEEIVRAADRAAGLTRQLLAFSRRQVLQPRELNLNEVVAGLERLLQRAAGDGVELTTELDPALVPVRADPGQLEQVILNLTMNARDAMPDGGRLRLTTQTVVVGEDEERLSLGPGRHAALTVSDTGHGIADDVRPHLFEPFFTTKAHGKGTGLGLASVYGTVKQSGGDVEVDSTPGQGASFTVYLPESGVVRVEVPDPDEAPAGGAGETILLVQERELFRGLVREILQRAGYRVLEAQSGAEALRVLAETRGLIDLLVADVVMPELGGVELAERLRAALPDLPVLFTSGDAGAECEVPAGSPFIGGPFLPDALARAVRDALDGERAA